MLPLFRSSKRACRRVQLQHHLVAALVRTPSMTTRCMGTQSVNPATNELLAEFTYWSNEEAGAAAERSMKAFRDGWKKTSFAERRAVMTKAGELLRVRKETLAKLISLEMGKPVAEGRGEIEKCALICDYYAKMAEQFLQPELVSQEEAMAPLPGSKNMVTFQPIGPILIIMPWNFPFWQVFRQASTALSAGNTVMLKHAPNVFGCAEAIEQIFIDAGAPDGVFQNVPIDGPQASELISHPAVRGMAFTGSSAIGAKVGAIAGSLVKPHVLELGGSDPYIILEDADVDNAVATSCAGRLLNAGQSCIGAKRFICVDEVHDEFVAKLCERFRAVKVGDPLDDATQMGPMVHVPARDKLHKQVTDSVGLGATLVMGGEIPEGPGAFYPPTVLTNIKKGQPAYGEEFFGPVANIFRAKDEAEAIAIANDTEFGLGGAVFTADLERGQRIATEEMEVGLCFVNDFVKSHQALPFGGMKGSGVGRECGEYGIKQLTNMKTVVVK